MRDLVCAVKGGKDVHVLAFGLLELGDDLKRGAVEVLRDELDAFLRHLGDPGCALLELDLEDVHAGLVEIVEVGLHGRVAFLLVAVEMDEERRRSIRRVEGAGYEPVHDLFLGGGDRSFPAAAGCKQAGCGCEKDRGAEDSGRILHKGVVLGYI